MIQIKNFLFICLISCSFGCAMETEIEKIHNRNVEEIKVDLNAACSFCLDSLSVRKGSITTLYCGHSVHSLCYVQWVNKCKRKTCFCGASLVDYDEEGYDALKNYNKDNQNERSYIGRVVALCLFGSRFTLDVAVKSYNVVHEMYSTAYDQYIE